MESSNAGLADKIQSLKREKNAIILAHNYQLGEVQDVADFVGDSLELSQQAARTQAEVIVFCGVHFMAETASILSPDKIVLLPEVNAGCPMANMITAEKLRQKKKELPQATVVSYINTTAAVKAESDLCCTSTNAVDLVAGLENEQILFVPDKYLGLYVSSRVKGKKITLWPGFCPVHAGIKPGHILKLKKEYPLAKVVVHPECRPEVIEIADEVLSTGGMCRYAKLEGVTQMIVGTEIGIIHRMQKENPGKLFIPVFKQAVCPTMKMITLDKIIRSLETLSPEVKVPEDIRVKAIGAVNRMLEIC
ncbi:MAG: quinolinate synthase NadA [Dehalococcoidales bacterium]|nr:quinolinate synthase NadA [Dehalococcoidales bacterium]